MQCSIGLRMDADVKVKLEVIKQYHRRKTSDMVRILIEDEYKKILHNDILTGINCQDEKREGNSSE